MLALPILASALGNLFFDKTPYHVQQATASAPPCFVARDIHYVSGMVDDNVGGIVAVQTNPEGGGGG